MKTRDLVVLESEFESRPHAPGEQEFAGRSSDASKSAPSPAIDGLSGAGGARVGTLVGFSAEGIPLIELPTPPATNGPVPARTVVALSPREIGRDVVLLFEKETDHPPIIMGVLQSAAAPEAMSAGTPVMARLDGEQLVLTAEREIVLRCGQSSITLTRAGKVLIRGAYLSSRSSGVNRIKGGSVQIN